MLQLGEGEGEKVVAKKGMIAALTTVEAKGRGRGRERAKSIVDNRRETQNPEGA